MLRTCLAAAIAASVCADFVHPGVLISPAQLATIRVRLAAHTEPTAAFFTAAQSSVQGSLSYVPFGPPASGYVECGPYDVPNVGCSNETSDADAAYLHALFFALGEPAAHATLAARILDLYATSLHGYKGSNSPLQASWVVAKFTRAAELLANSPGAGWSAASAKTFSDWLYQVHLPLFYNCLPENGNWDLSSIEAMAGIAVFSSNATLLAHALSRWRARVPAYIWIPADGPRPVPLPCGAGDTTWYGQETFNSSTAGVCQETCRDFGHLQMGIGAAMNAAATFTAQGIDAFAEQAPRLVQGAEFAAHFLRGAPVPAFMCSGAGIKLAFVATWEVAFSELSVRLGHPMPLTWEQITTAVRAPPIGSHQDGIVSVWETLTHGVPAAAALKQ